MRSVSWTGDLLHRARFIPPQVNVNVSKTESQTKHK
jgi:hypothetical protein